MSEARGSGVQTRDKADSAPARKRSVVVSEELQSAIGAQVQSALAKVLEQFGSQFKQVQGALSALGDRLEGLEHLVQSTAGESSQDTSDIASPTKRGRPAPSSDGAIFLRELSEVGSTFKTNLRDRVRRFCLSKDGHLYFTPQKHLFVGKNVNLVYFYFIPCISGFGRHCEPSYENFEGVLGFIDGQRCYCIRAS